MTKTKRTYYTVGTEQDSYWLRKALEEGSTRLTGQDDWYRIHFPTKDAAEEFVRDAFADYCEDVPYVATGHASFVCDSDRISAAKEINVSTILLLNLGDFRGRLVPDGTSIEVADWGQMTVTRKVEVQVVKTSNERREVVVEGETYSKEIKREVASSWYEAYPQVVRVQVNTVEMYIVGEEA
jgi:hypothetical protein